MRLGMHRAAVVVLVLVLLVLVLVLVLVLQLAVAVEEPRRSEPAWGSRRRLRR